MELNIKDFEVNYNGKCFPIGTLGTRYFLLYVEGWGFGGQSKPSECSFTTKYEVYKASKGKMELVGEILNSQEGYSTSFSGNIEGTSISMPVNVDSIFMKIYKKGN